VKGYAPSRNRVKPCGKRLRRYHAPHPEVLPQADSKGEGHRSMEVTVYILRCADGSYYTGLTKQDLEARVWEHNNLPDEKSYTAKRRPVTLVFTETYDRIVDAIERERQIKGWSRRKKEALIRLDYEGLPELSRRGHLVGAKKPD